MRSGALAVRGRYAAAAVGRRPRSGVAACDRVRTTGTPGGRASVRSRAVGMGGRSRCSGGLRTSAAWESRDRCRHSACTDGSGARYRSRGSRDTHWRAL
jgi:hypothetical protein